MLYFKSTNKRLQCYDRTQDRKTFFILEEVKKYFGFSTRSCESAVNSKSQIYFGWAWYQYKMAKYQTANAQL